MARQTNDETVLEKEFDKLSRQELRNSAGKKDDIMKAAIQLFLEQGYCNTTVRQIAQATNTSPSLIIYHFGTKQAIAHAFLKYKLQEMRSELLQIVDIHTDPELFCCSMVRLFQTAMSSSTLCRFYHDMIEEGLFREFFFTSDEGINASVLILAKHKIKLPPKIANFYSHYIIPSVEMALWISSNEAVPLEETLDIPFRTLMGLLSVPTNEIDDYCIKGQQIVKQILDDHPEFLTFN